MSVAVVLRGLKGKGKGARGDVSDALGHGAAPTDAAVLAVTKRMAKRSLIQVRNSAPQYLGAFQQKKNVILLHGRRAAGGGPRRGKWRRV